MHKDSLKSKARLKGPEKSYFVNRPVKLNCQNKHSSLAEKQLYLPLYSKY